MRDTILAPEEELEQEAVQPAGNLLHRAARQLIGISPAIRELRQNIKVLARHNNVDLLICGETGTGKEVVVNSVHDQSVRANKPLVKINCGAIPENLLESELFGYEKGAFTGAARCKKGLVELADGGTVFLDEIGEMPLFMQAKLLNFLEDRSFRRVGGLRDVEVDVRVAAATNRDLEEEVRRGRFREDLYYRLNVLRLQIPPLRERPEDVAVLCQFFLEHFNQKFQKDLKSIDPVFLRVLEGYAWRGNVRELRNVMERCALFSQGEVLTGTKAELPQSPLVRREEEFCPRKDLRQGPIDLKKEVEAFEMSYIREALELTQGNLSQAAELLGTTRFTLKRRLEQTGSCEIEHADVK